MEARFDDLLNFPFWFSIDNVRWQLFIVRAVGLGRTISGEKINMENRVDLH